MSRMIEQLIASADIVRRVSENPSYASVINEHLRQQEGWSSTSVAMASIEMWFAERWSTCGRITYELTHSMAALFAMTSAPSIDWKKMPHDYFLIKVPREFFPLVNVRPSPDTWILAGQRSAIVIPDHDTTAVCTMVYPECMERPDDIDKLNELHNIGERVVNTHTINLCGRFLSNTIAYITEHRETLPTVSAQSSNDACSAIVVRPPAGVVISKEFRDAASSVSSSASLVGVRRSMAHFVRGHWRNQRVGEGLGTRKLTWVRPHRRGSESLGSVVARIERISGHANP